MCQDLVGNCGPDVQGPMCKVLYKPKALPLGKLTWISVPVEDQNELQFPASWLNFAAPGLLDERTKNIYVVCVTQRSSSELKFKSGRLTLIPGDANLHQALVQQPTFLAQHRYPSWRTETCSSQDKFNATSYDTMAVGIITLQAFAGMILLFLGCFRFWYLCITWVYSFLSIIYPWCYYVHPILQLFAVTQSFLNSSNLWVSACLCVFYCTKIANFRHVFFIYLKVKIDRIVPLLLGSVLLSLVICILAYDITDKAHCNNLNSTTPGNLWLSVRMDEHFFPIFMSGFGFATAFAAVIFSALLLLFSLWRCKHKMQTNSVKNLSMDAHIKAMKSILSFFFIYSINFICLILTLIYATKKENPVTFLILVFQYAFPAVHSLILIFSNPRLEKTLLRTLPCVKCKVCMR
ncbi:LOW QUALITY PROTEIN: taste receptor type 2 member 10-like [Sarcoramphus papa]